MATDDLLERALGAVRNLFNDTSARRSVTRAALETVRDDIDLLLATLKEDDDDQDNTASKASFNTEADPAAPGAVEGDDDDPSVQVNTEAQNQ